jgi:hypothetical protein
MIITAAYGALALFGAKQVYSSVAGGIVADPVWRPVCRSLSPATTPGQWVRLKWLRGPKP